MIQSMQLPEQNQIRRVLIVYSAELCDLQRLNQQVLPSAQTMFQTGALSKGDPQEIVSAWTFSPLRYERELENMIVPIFEGMAVLFFDGIPYAFLAGISKPPQREPAEPNTEISVKGPRDGFTEELFINLGLIRKRLKTNSLEVEMFRVGKRSQTRISLLYLRDVAKESVISDVRERINKIDSDGVYSTSQLEEQIVDSKLSIFPQMDYTGRPDYATDSLLKGRFVLVIDGVPVVLIAPCNLFLMLKASEDLYTNYFYGAFERALRILGLLIAVLLPGFYVAITSFHQDQIPLTLLATLLIARKGIPFTVPLESFLMLLLFELFREAGMRLPGKVGQTLAVVGGLIIGDAAIRAGIASPSLLVVAGTTAVTTFTLINQSLAGAVSILRFLIMVLCSFLGLFGFFIGVFAVIAYMSSLRSFGAPYLAPAAPLYWKDLHGILLRMPGTKMQRRPGFLKLKDKTRKGGTYDEE